MPKHAEKPLLDRLEQLDGAAARQLTPDAAVPAGRLQRSSTRTGREAPCPVSRADGAGRGRRLVAAGTRRSASCLAPAHIHLAQPALPGPNTRVAIIWAKCSTWVNAQPGHCNRIGLIDASCARWVVSALGDGRPAAAAPAPAAAAPAALRLARGRAEATGLHHPHGRRHHRSVSHFMHKLFKYLSRTAATLLP